MRILAITLVAAGSLGVMALGGRAIAADRAPRARHSVAADSGTEASASATATRLWYGGTLAPIQVQASAPAASAAAPKPDCPQRN
jgi:hypothetical protein